MGLVVSEDKTKNLQSSAKQSTRLEWCSKKVAMQDELVVVAFDVETTNVFFGGHYLLL